MPFMYRQETDPEDRRASAGREKTYGYRLFSERLPDPSGRDPGKITVQTTDKRLDNYGE